MTFRGIQFIAMIIGIFAAFSIMVYCLGTTEQVFDDNGHPYGKSAPFELTGERGGLPKVLSLMWLVVALYFGLFVWYWATNQLEIHSGFWIAFFLLFLLGWLVNITT